MGVTAQQIIDIMDSWVGLSRAKGTHKPIIDLYNSHKPLARDYAVGYNDSYCDTTVSAAFIKAGAVDLIGGTECGVEEHVKLFKKAGIWIEDGTITPEIGDIVVFNWDDATQPNDGYSDHIGVVRSVGSKNFETTEGNMSGGIVGHRTIAIGWGYIRGFARPKYAKANNSTPKPEKPDTGANKKPTEATTTAKTYTVKSGDTDAYMDGIISKEDYSKRYKELEKILEDLKDKLLTLEVNEDLQSIEEVIQNIDKEMEEYLQTQSFKESRVEFLNQHLTKITVNKDSFLLEFDLIGGAILTGKDFYLFVDNPRWCT